MKTKKMSKKSKPRKLKLIKIFFGHRHLCIKTDPVTILKISSSGDSRVYMCTF